jgi:hypothetical protein
MPRSALTAVRRPPRRIGVPLLGLLVLVGWLVPGRLGSADVAIPELSLPGVRVVVGDVAPERLLHPASMPAGMMPDELPAGWRRVSVAVTVVGEDGDAAGYAGSSFRLVGDALPAPAVPVRETVGSGRLPEGVRVSGRLLFQVPASARTVALTADGSEDRLDLVLPERGPGADGAHAAG